MPQRDQIIAWLKDAHAMEQSLASVLQQHIKDARDFPPMRDKLQEHLDQTRGHAEQVRECLQLLGDAPSSAKSTAAGVMGMVEGMSTSLFRDGLVKNAVADYAMEHFEMACYSALATAAEEAGIPEVARACHDIFGEEAEMAEWLEEQVPEVTRMHLLQATGAR